MSGCLHLVLRPSGSVSSEADGDDDDYREEEEAALVDLTLSLFVSLSLQKCLRSDLRGGGASPVWGAQRRASLSTIQTRRLLKCRWVSAREQREMMPFTTQQSIRRHAQSRQTHLIVCYLTGWSSYYCDFLFKCLVLSDDSLCIYIHILNPTQTQYS